MYEVLYLVHGDMLPSFTALLFLGKQTKTES